MQACVYRNTCSDVHGPWHIVEPYEVSPVSLTLCTLMRSGASDGTEIYLKTHNYINSKGGFNMIL